LKNATLEEEKKVEISQSVNQHSVIHDAKQTCYVARYSLFFFGMLYPTGRGAQPNVIRAAVVALG
jgi:hypothetical protein